VGRTFCHSTKCLILYHFVLCTWCCFTNHFRRLYIYIFWIVKPIIVLVFFFTAVMLDILSTGAWGMDFVSSSPLFFTTPPFFSKFSYKSFLFQNFHNHSFFSSFDNISRRHTSWIIRVFCVHSLQVGKKAVGRQRNLGLHLK
jgi:hypothetical protein